MSFVFLSIFLCFWSSFPELWHDTSVWTCLDDFCWCCVTPQDSTGWNLDGTYQNKHKLLLVFWCDYTLLLLCTHTGGNSPHKNEDLKARQNPKGIFTVAPCDTRCVARAINGASGGTEGIANAYIADVPWRRLSDEGSQKRNEWICLAHSSSLLLSCVWRWLFDMFFVFFWSNILCKFKRYRILDRKSRSRVKRQIYAREVYICTTMYCNLRASESASPCQAIFDCSALNIFKNSSTDHCLGMIHQGYHTVQIHAVCCRCASSRASNPRNCRQPRLKTKVRWPTLWRSQPTYHIYKLVPW